MHRIIMCSALCSLMLCAKLHAEVPQQLIDRIKSSVVAVEYPTGGSATAFCIDSTGVFLTNRHVARKFMTQPCRLHLANRKWSGNAYAVALSEVHDLGLMMCVDEPSPGTLTALPLSDSMDVRESQRLIVAGFPGPSAHFEVGKKFPETLVPGTVVEGSIVISEGEVVAVRPWFSKETLINFHASSTRGGSGSPILDSTGHVIGVLFGGSDTRRVQDAGAHAFILGHTIRSLRRFLENGPHLNVVADPVSFNDRTKPASIMAFALGVNGPASENRVSVALYSDKQPRSFWLARKGPGRFQSQIPLLAGSQDKLHYAAQVQFTNGQISGLMLDQPIVKAERPMYGAEFFRLERRKNFWWVWKRIDKQPYQVPQLASSIISLRTGNAKWDVKIEMVKRIEIFNAAVPYAAVIQHDREIVKRVDGEFLVDMTAPLPQGTAPPDDRNHVSSPSLSVGENLNSLLSNQP